jgi:hypothetical protein
MLDGATQFFVDEDANRIGQEFLGRPVIHPASVPHGGSVYVTFPPSHARAIRGRLEQTYPSVSWLVPPNRAGRGSSSGTV